LARLIPVPFGPRNRGHSCARAAEWSAQQASAATMGIVAGNNLMRFM